MNGSDGIDDLRQRRSERVARDQIDPAAVELHRLPCPRSQRRPAGEARVARGRLVDIGDDDREARKPDARRSDA